MDLGIIQEISVTLRTLLMSELGFKGKISLGNPGDESQGKNGPLGINVFLYHVVDNIKLRTGRLGDDTTPPLMTGSELNFSLFYLISLMGADLAHPAESAHSVLGKTITAVNQNETIDKKYYPSGSQLASLSGIRLRMNAMSLEEITKLWTALRVPLRPSIPCEAIISEYDQ
ncbi:MAG: Pvc16 family protein [Nitrososphaerales archaeon]